MSKIHDQFGLKIVEGKGCVDNTGRVRRVVMGASKAALNNLAEREKRTVEQVLEIRSVTFSRKNGVRTQTETTHFYGLLSAQRAPQFLA